MLISHVKIMNVLQAGREETLRKLSYICVNFLIWWNSHVGFKDVLSLGESIALSYSHFLFLHLEPRIFKRTRIPSGFQDI